jgi:predicted phosphodiesterase
MLLSQGYKKEYLLDLFTKFEGKYKKIPTRREMTGEYGVREDSFCRNFGSWEEAKIAYKATKVAANSILTLDTYLDEDQLFGSMVGAEQAQEDITNVFSKINNFKILALSDIELPYANLKMINAAVIKAQEEGATVCVLNGDITHSDFFSKHAKHTYISPQEEYSQLEQLIAWLSTKFAAVVLVSGNHDRMVRRFCQRAIPQYESMQFLVKDDLLEIVSAKYENVFYAKNWWAKIKDVIYMHPDSFTVLPMRTPIGAAKIVQKLGVDAAAWVQGHTHKVGEYTEGNHVYYETGCSCLPQDYYMSRGSIRWENAYNIIDIKDGKFNYNESRNYKWSN